MTAAAAAAAPLLFYRENKPLGELSNFFKLSAPLIYNGRSYASSEHLYQTLKFVYDGASRATQEYAETVRLAKTPNQSRVLAQMKIGGGYAWRTALNTTIRRAQTSGVQPRPDWDAVKVEQMRIVLRLKFLSNAQCAVALARTGRHPLAENSPYDSFWGLGKRGDGTNWLGRLLVELRHEMFGHVTKRSSAAVTTSDERAKKRMLTTAAGDDSE